MLCLSRGVLRRVIVGLSGDAVFVRAAMHLGHGGEVAMRRRSRRLPFQRSRMPGSVGLNFLSVADAPKQIDDERNLSESETDRGPENPLMQPHYVGQQSTLKLGVGHLRILRATVSHAA